MLHPKKGFNVFTGETGAGKTLLINAIRFGIGDSFNRESIFRKEDLPHVEISFAIPPDKQKSDDHYPFSSPEWVCERYLTPSGKNRTRINGVLVSLKEYKSAIRGLLSIHGQHDNSHLFSRKNQLRLFDRFFENDLKSHLDFIKDNRKSFLHQKELLLHHEQREKDRQQEIDFLVFQIDEIDNARLCANEEDNLIKERDLLSHAHQIIETLEKIQESFCPSVNPEISIEDSFSQCVSLMYELSSYSKALSQHYESLQNSYLLLKDTLKELQSEKERIENGYDPIRLDYIVSRLDEIQRLKRKYGSTITEILSNKEQLSTKLKKLQQEQSQCDNLVSTVSGLENDLVHHALLLSEKRTSLKHHFEKAVKKELADLGMAKIQFEVLLETEPFDGLSSINVSQGNVQLFDNGINSIHYLISTNPGQGLLPLAKIASGGELSRIMLSIQSILGHSDHMLTLIFDEIDTGIGGQMGHEVGNKLRSLAASHQLICITHLPQIAARAEYHFLISKSSTDNETSIHVSSLDDSQRIDEITRMISGNEAADTARMHAMEMLGRSHDKG